MIEAQNFYRKSAEGSDLHTKTRKKYFSRTFFLRLLFAFSLFCLGSVGGSFSALAQEESEQAVSKKFVVSAYYSPLPNQKEYVRGNFEAEKRLQGEGLRGADYTKVYVGMIAAPKTYEFGTRVLIPGLGAGTVHDRGGAIYAGKDFDRIDVWMGYGDDGRVRALEWGMRTIEGKILPASSPETMNFAILSKEQATNSVLSLPTTFKTQSAEPSNSSSSTDFTSSMNPSLSEISNPVVNTQSLSKGDKGDRVKNLQNFLIKEGFFEGTATGYYGPRTASAVLQFQKFYEIVSSDTETGAGVYGPTTQQKVKELWDTDNSMRKYAVDFSILPVGIGLGDNGKEVKRLQIIMKELGYFDETPNGNYGPQTQASILRFQKEKKIVSLNTDLGAGYFGPQTSRMLSLELLEKRKHSKAPHSFQTLEVSAQKLAQMRIKSSSLLQKTKYEPVKIKEMSAL